jgi:hypothetical protein
MDSMDAIEVDGEWWLPELPDRRVHGRLTVAATGRATLHLMNGLRSTRSVGETTDLGNGQIVTTFTEDSLEKAAKYPRILGEASGTAYTLDDCLSTHRSNLFADFGGSERVHAHQVFKGVWLEGGEEAAFISINVNIQWLPYWMQESGLEEVRSFETDETGNIVAASEAEIRVRSLPAKQVTTAAGATVTIHQSFGLGGDRVVERSLTQSFDVTVETPNLSPVADLVKIAGDIQSLVAAGTGRQAAFQRVSLKHPDVTNNSDPAHLRSIQFFAHWQVQPEKTATLHPHDMLFTFSDLGGIAGVGDWLAVADANRSQLGHVLASRHDNGMRTSDRVLNVAAALEAYDREKHLDTRSHARRLTRCASHAGDPFTDLVGDVAIWVGRMKSARNDVAHHNLLPSTASDGQLYLALSGYYLFLLCLLRDAHAPKDVFDRMEQHDHFRWVKRRLGEL